MGELGKHEQTHIVKRLIADDGVLGDVAHTLGAQGNFFALRRTGKSGLTGGGIIEIRHVSPFPTLCSIRDAQIQPIDKADTNPLR